jgi:hypothetical protein
MRHWRNAILMAALSAVLPVGAAVPELDGASGLSPFASETELQAYAQALVDRRRERDAALLARRKAEQDAYRKAHPARASMVLVGTTTPGATVVVKSYQMDFERKLTADAQGRYHLAGLSPNSFYVVRTGDETKYVRTGDDAINAIDVASVESTTILTSKQIASIPVARDITSVALLAPGTVKPADAITNVQTAGVDEGGIVKKAGDFLVVLRRGRLFSIRADGEQLRVVSTVNAYGPELSGQDAWYDEMLISGRTLVVIGFSYEREGTEVGLFDLAPDGRLSYRATYQLRSNDYYSSRNYASRLIGDTLILYTPLDLFPGGGGVPRFPGVRRLSGGGDAFQRIAPAEQVYRSRIAEDSLAQTLHTVTRCKLGGDAMDCKGTSVIGPEGSAFYVSGSAVYLWLVSQPDFRDREARQELSSVVRMPLDGSVPSALRVQGAPIDQLSFLEQDGVLNVLVGADAEGLRMWQAEGSSGGLALLRAPIRSFGGASTWSRPEQYRSLPSGTGKYGFWGVQNRYVGPWLLYGAEEKGSGAFALRIDRPDAPTALPLGHSVERIEAMGEDALLVGSAGQEDRRTHGFFYQPRAAREGLFGLPVVQGEEPRQRASVQFLRNSNLQLAGVGALAAGSGGELDDAADGCVASCVDWYGNARPIFIGDRVYGLLGYELVEGALVGGRIRERRRLDFMPAAGRASR